MNSSSSHKIGTFQYIGHIYILAMALACIYALLFHEEIQGRLPQYLGVIVFLLASPWVVWSLFKFPNFRVIFFVCCLLGLDDPTGNPFYEYNPVTEVLGALVFRPLKQSLPIGIPFSILEIFSILAGGLIISKHALTLRTEIRTRELLGGSEFILALALWGLVVCLARNQDFGDAQFQARSLPIYVFMGALGLAWIKNMERLWLFLSMMTAVSIFKAIQGIFVWLIIWGDGAQHRYLIDHYFSDAFIHSLSMLFLTLFLPSGRRLAWRIAWRLICVVPLVTALYLNNRRTAYLGAAFSVVLLPIFFQALFQRLQWKLLISSGVFFAICGITILWKIFLGHSVGIHEDSSAYYRILENLNLLELVRNFPFFGAGLGREMPLVHVMDSVAHAYREFALIPHNTLLFIWAFFGPIGLTLFSCYSIKGVSQGIRIAHLPEAANDFRFKIVGFLVSAQIIRWLIYVYADMGLVESRFSVIIPIMIGASFKILSDRMRHNSAPEIYARSLPRKGVTWTGQTC
jgi:O-Antigen ligase